MSYFTKYLPFLIILSPFFFGPLLAKETLSKKPLFEGGLFGGVAKFSLYPGSGEYANRTLLLPYFFYRGKVFRSDRQGTRARLYKKKNWNFGLGFGGNVSSKSSESQIRKGMPELDLIFEIGPRARRYNLFKNKNLEFGASFKKANLFKGFKLYSQGYTFQTSLSLRKSFEALGQNTFYTRIALKLADQRYQDYFYTVLPSYQTPERPAYKAQGGILGIRYFAGLQKPVFNGKWVHFFGVTLQEYSLAANKNSPLHTHNMTYNLIYGFRISLFETKTRGYK